LRGQPMGLWLSNFAHEPIVGSFFSTSAAAYIFSYAGMAFDLGIVPLLLIRKTRRWAFGLAAAFNLTNSFLFDIGIFPWLALGATVILFSEGLPLPQRDLWEKGTAPIKRPAVWGPLFATVYALVQVLVPLRQWFYPGNVLWTEEGHRFSWRMKLRDKDAKLRVYAYDPDTRQDLDVSTLTYITSDQRGEAIARPDMVLQLAHFIGDDLRRHGHPRVQVKVRSQASLNGRLFQTLIDPAVDLAKIPRDLGHATWVVPLTEPLRSVGEKNSRVPISSPVPDAISRAIAPQKNAE
jgi:vitamin K-dependent gamma-carboxylase